MKKLQLIHGEGEIKRFDKQIKDAFKLLDGKDLDRVYVNTTLVNAIKKFGFDLKHSSGVAFIGSKQVIKVGYLTRFPPPPKYRVPTVIYYYDKLRRYEYDGMYVLMVQPKVDDRNFSNDQYLEMGRIEKRLSGSDYRSDNFGIYKNEVKLIDW